jgi:hypothetical protein
MVQDGADFINPSHLMQEGKRSRCEQRFNIFKSMGSSDPPYNVDKRMSISINYSYIL